MSKMFIMRGLPASGKSTKAAEIIKASGNTVRLNKDLIRTMLHFDKFNHVNESLTGDASKLLARHFLSHGKNVIIDDTNLNPKTLESWKTIAKEVDAKVEIVDLTDIPVADCLERDAKREKTVGRSVILKMALQYLDFMKGEKVIVCDLDGTLCHIDHRKHFLTGEKKDWKSFFEAIPGDDLRLGVYEKLYHALEENKAHVLFVSARPEDYREQTAKWLQEHLTPLPRMQSLGLIMRDSGDKRPDVEVKSDIFDRYLKNLNIVKVFDDRPSVIRMWREKGLEVEDVGEGIEF